jgi:hypothetical protein
MSLIIKALDENSFDATTSDVARVMFLPAVCSDQEYVFEVVQGKPLEVDDILKGSLSENKIPSPASPINPKDKKGVVGAFNRAYSITNTIEKFLSEIYIKADNFTLEAPRYRFKGSTSTPGARVYDNDTRFYSAHDKDPARGLNLDAFNLVKVQLFANDFAKCSAWAFALPEVKKEIAIPNEDNAKWINNLYRDKRGVFLPSLYNVTAILDNDPHLNGTFKLNTLTYMIENIVI